MRRTQVEVFVLRQNSSGPEYLALHRSEAKGGFWQPVTGGVLDDEPLSEAAVREVREETGLAFEKVVQIPYSFTFLGSEGIELTEYVFAGMVSPDSTVVLSVEHDDQKWVSIESMLGLLKFDENKVALGHVHDRVLAGL